ncbi:MAG: glycosyltransferase family 39 protein, partial [Winogradskyella sp.]|nr:glycosyltransferase family 39 protein [Winogradskyella sp.]
MQLGSWGITETSEARYAQISKEMVQNQDYLNPTLLGIKHYHKPVITYYITAFSYELFGISEYSSRLFLQFAIIIQLLLIYRITLLLFNTKSIAFAASLIYFSLPIVLISSRNLTTDAYLNTFVLGAIYFWLSYSKDERKILSLYLFYILLGLGMETKGPVSLLFPLTFIITYKLSLKQHFSKKIHHLFGFAIFLVISASWYIILIIDNPFILNYFIEDQLLSRIASNSFNRGKPFWFYLLLVPAVSLPWLFIIIFYIRSRFKQIIQQKDLDFILITSILVLTVVFSLFKTKLIMYVLPMFGFIAIVSAYILHKAKTSQLFRYNYYIVGLGIIIVFAITLGPLFLPDFSFSLSLGLLMGIPLIVLSVYFLRKSFKVEYLRTATLGYVLGLITLFFGTSFIAENESKLNSTKAVFEYVKNYLPEESTIVVYNYLMPSAQFYMDKPII